MAIGPALYFLVNVLTLNSGGQQCCRNTNITNLATYPALYLESNLNNTLGPNTSPFFLNPGAKFFCVGQPFTWSQAAAEPDQDSMVFTLAQPWSADNTPIPWAPGYSTQQPMTTANGFNFNPATGVFQFTPTQAEVDVIKIVVEEYRFDTISFNWLLVGTAIREMQIPVLSTCNPIAYYRGKYYSGNHHRWISPANE